MCNNVKGQPMEWKEIFANQVSGKGLKSRISKEFLQQRKKERKRGREGKRKEQRNPK